MMTTETIYAGENSQLEFKREPHSDARKWVKTAIAFANGRGGSIVFGVDDKTKQIVGVDPDRAAVLADSVANAASHLAAPPLPLQIHLQTLEGKTIVVAKVDGGANTPYHFKGQEPPNGVFVRVGATTRPAEREHVRELMLDGANRTYEYMDFRPLPYTGLQIFGSVPSILADASEKALKRNPNIDFIDVNMGCPVPKVIRSGSGSKLMRDPELCGDIVAAIKRRVDVTVTAKIRL